MSKERGKRLEIAMDKLGKGQAEVAAILKVSQPQVSNRIRGIAELTFKDCELLESAWGLSKLWLYSQEGSMMVNTKVTGEPTIIYESLKVETTVRAITERFVREVKVYADSHDELLSRDIANLLHTSESQWTQVKRGEKEMTPTMLAHGVLNMGVDANYVVAEIESNPAYVKRLEAEVERLKKENENQALFIELLKERSAAQKKSA